MGQDISNRDDTIDSRDIIKRIEELEGERDYHNETHGADHWTTVCSDESAELAALLALQSEAEGYCEDWKYGASLIRHSYFEDYAQQMAEECGDYKASDVKWPYTCIDWTQAAKELAQDYTTVDFGGVEYYVR